MIQADAIAPSDVTRHTLRQRDRRESLSALLVALSRSLTTQSGMSMMREAFEQAIRRMVPVRAIRLRDSRSRWFARTVQSQEAESIVLDVPTSNPTVTACLQAVFDPGCGLGDWDFQMLALATHIGALVLEIERGRTQLARAGLLNLERAKRDGAAPIVGSSPVMQALRASIERVATTDFTVLLEGESGVGKELVAHQIHTLGRRRNGPFVAINCAALVETLLEAELFGIEERTATGVRGRKGKFEHADGGTLFLDEVSDLSMTAQAKLLRAIQDLAIQRVGGYATHVVDIRIIAATNRSLADLVSRRLFRADLFYRLSGVDIRVPTLRERRGDILELANYFLDRHRVGRPLQLTAAAADALTTYDWPGNVRELERMMERAVALVEHDVIELEDLPSQVRGAYSTALGPSLKRNETLRLWACRYIRLVVSRCGGNKRAACRVLGITYHTLQAYLRAPFYDVDREDEEDASIVTERARSEDHACGEAACMEEHGHGEDADARAGSGTLIATTTQRT